MKFLLDESVDFPLAEYLSDLGHDVTAIAHDYPGALKDRDVLRIAHDEGRVLITNDHDFGELVFRQKMPHAGVILFRLHVEDLKAKSERLKRALQEHPHDLSQFVVITDGGIRIRRLD